MSCPRCNADTHRDFPDKAERCSGCDRTVAWCRCELTTAERVPLWIERSRERRNGLARDLTEAVA